eukprot:gene3584-7123_t
MAHHDDIRTSLIRIQNIVKGEAFESWRRSFVDKYCNEFDYGEENKLIYTEIHKNYEQQLEKRIAEELPDDFNMDSFLQNLPEFVEGPGSKDTAISESITILLEVADFQQFKEMMSFRKRELEETDSKSTENLLDGIKAHGKELGLLDVDEMMDQCATLASAADDVEGWENLLSLDWMRIDKKPVEAANRKSSKEIYLRGVWTMNLSFVECCDMMFSMGERRHDWDSNFTSCEFPLGGTDRDEDVVTSAHLNFGYLINLVMFGGGPATLTCRNIRRWDLPAPCSVTYAMFPWDLSTGTVDSKHKLLSLKTGTIIPHPSGDSDKSVMTTLEKNTMGGMPRWALHWMMRATAPQMMRGLESRYIANVKNKGKVVDVTPGGSGDNDNDNDKDKDGESKETAVGQGHKNKK